MRLAAHKTQRVTGEARLIPLRRHIVRLLRVVYARRPTRGEDGFVFLNSRNVPWTKSSFTVAFRRYARMAGIRPGVTAYSVRHGLCINLIERGRSDRQIADALGQRTTRLVSWYGRQSRGNADYLRRILEG